MNQRFYELIRLSAVSADQAEDYAHAKGLIEPTEKLDVAKFAELIVRECMNVILLDGKKIADAMPDADRNNYTMVAEQTGMINASLRYSDKIKQHFGVEE